MRLTALMTKQLDEQMQIDLTKLFPDEILTELLAQTEQDPNTVWLLAKFNGRYIGAALFNLQEAQLNALTVREVTRRRGVGRFLVEHCCQQLVQQGRKAQLHLSWHSLTADTQAFLANLQAEEDPAGGWLI
jgi:GNAT superfamily N-acetyltransferase